VIGLAINPLAGKPETPGARAAIRSVFGRFSSQAIRVATCESHLNVYARNGQYLGMFQMGNFARSRFGHGWTPWAQARAAYRYFTYAHGWGPWQCKP
jgi:hypothetical protein